MESPADNNPQGRPWTRIALVVLLALGIGARLLGAWLYRHDHNPDFGICALMAKHMAAGMGFPVFFYGQAYMGSIEPAVSAFFCRLLGSSGFAVCLGTAFVGMFILPVVYLWARDAAGRVAGLAALAYCIIGPSGYFHYLASPRGGYAITILAGPLILWMAVRIVLQEVNNGRCHLARYALLGVVAGLAWWSNQLVTAALATAALLLAVALWRKALTLKPFAALLGFFLGSLPFWLWNAANDWQTFAFTRSFGRTPFLQGLGRFAGECMLRLFDVYRTDAVTRAGIVSFHALAIAACVVATGRIVRKKGLKGPQLHVVTALSFFVVSAVLFSRSHFAKFGTPRYLLPLVPVLALLVGVATRWLTERVRPWLGWAPLLAVVLFQIRGPLFHYERTQERRDFCEKVQNLGERLDTNGVSTVYTPFGLHGMNFLLEERIRFCGLGTDRYLPYSQAAESDDDMAVLGDYDQIRHFLATTGTSSQHAGAGELVFRHRFSPPGDGIEEVSTEELAAITDSRRTDIAALVSDRNHDTSWQPSSSAMANRGLYVRLKAPREISAVRLVPRELTCRAKWRIELRDGPDSKWRDALPVSHVTRYYWSGPRPYWGGRFPRLESRFTSRRASEIRICFDVPDIEIVELHIFGPGSDPLPETSAWPDLYAAIRTNGVRSLYSDRWVANQVHRMAGGKIRTTIEPEIFPDCDSVLPADLEPTRDCALLVRTEDAALTAHLLADRKLPMRRTPIGPWVLFAFGPGDWQDGYADAPGLRWSGCGLLETERKKWSRSLVKRAEAAYATTGAGEEPIALLTEALQVYGNFRPARLMLSKWLAEAGRTAEAARIETEAAGMWKPAISTAVRFKNGVQLLGVDLPGTPVHAGETFQARYFWRCPPEVESSRLAAFVHFKNGDRLFQDDHVLLDKLLVSFQPYPDEVFVEERSVNVPADIPEGDYTVDLGLHDRDPPAERLRPKTDLAVHRRAVTLPVSVAVETP
jgi:4-amino-4-deoxy-L-arabinose transferase-like glycosyltransferase